MEPFLESDRNDHLEIHIKKRARSNILIKALIIFCQMKAGEAHWSLFLLELSVRTSRIFSDSE